MILSSLEIFDVSISPSLGTGHVAQAIAPFLSRQSRGDPVISTICVRASGGGSERTEP